MTILKFLFKSFFFGFFILSYANTGEAKMNSNLSFQEYPIWQIVGETSCSGRVFLNDFMLQKFDSKKNSALQIPVTPIYLKNGKQTVRVLLDESCLSKKPTAATISIRLAGFKPDDMPATNKAETKIKNPFGKFPAWGKELLSLSGAEAKASGEITKSGGLWPQQAPWKNFNVLTLDEKLKKEVEAILSQIHSAVAKGDEPFLSPMIKLKIELSYPDEQAEMRNMDFTDFQERVRSRPKSKGFEMMPLPATPWSFRLIENKIVEVTSADNDVIIKWKNETSKTPMPWKFLLAKKDGRWIFY